MKKINVIKTNVIIYSLSVAAGTKLASYWPGHSPDPAVFLDVEQIAWFGHTLCPCLQQDPAPPPISEHLPELNRRGS
jgi:hypothetical protein